MTAFQLVILIILFSLSPVAREVDSVNIVYRVDQRDISDIISAGGMWPNIDVDEVPDNNLMHHFEGEAVENGHSNFVSTSGSLQSVIHFAALRAREDSSSDYDQDFETYLYRVRPASYFYNVDTSLTAERDMFGRDSPEWGRLNTLLRDYGGMGEFAAREGFPHSRIISYARLTGDMLNQYLLHNEDNSELFTESFWRERWIEHDGYNHEFDQNVTSSQVYPYVGQPTGVMRQAVNGTQPPVPLSFTCLGVGSLPHSSNNRSVRSEGVCPSSEHMTISRKVYDDRLLVLFIN